MLRYHFMIPLSHLSSFIVGSHQLFANMTYMIPVIAIWNSILYRESMQATSLLMSSYLFLKLCIQNNLSSEVFLRLVIHLHSWVRLSEGFITRSYVTMFWRIFPSHRLPYSYIGISIWTSWRDKKMHRFRLF